MNKTNIGLVQHSEKALREGWAYMWGEFGRFITPQLIDSNIRQWPDNSRWRNYLQNNIGRRGSDCNGIVKSYLWWVDNNSNPIYNASQDFNTTRAFNRSIINGILSTIPEIPGIMLWMPGHVGVYMGNGRFVEIMGNGVGVYEGFIQNGRITRGSRFTHWYREIAIEYIDNFYDKEEEEEMRYNTIQEIPEWGRPTIQKLINQGLLNGNNGGLNLTEDMIRMFVINDRAGLYK